MLKKTENNTEEGNLYFETKKIIMLLLLCICFAGCGKKEDFSAKPESKQNDGEIRALKNQIADLKDRVEFLEKKMRVEDERQFEKEQKAKGLVKYQGKWMTEEEKQKLEEEESKRKQNYAKVRNLPRQGGKGLVYYSGRWVTPEERLEMEKIKKEDADHANERR